MLRRNLFHFVLIGAVAFLFDAATYFLAAAVFVFLLGQDVPIAQKVIAFLAGVTTTYLYNSRITFPVAYSWDRFLAYILSQSFGMLVNVIVFVLLDRAVPVLGALIGATLVAALVNFIGARRCLDERG